MNKSELVDVVAKSADISKAAAERARQAEAQKRQQAEEARQKKAQERLAAMGRTPKDVPGGTALAFRQASNWASRQGFTEGVRERFKVIFHGDAKAKLTKAEEVGAGIVGGTLSGNLRLERADGRRHLRYTDRQDSCLRPFKKHYGHAHHVFC